MTEPVKKPLNNPEPQGLFTSRDTVTGGFRYSPDSARGTKLVVEPLTPRADLKATDAPAIKALERAFADPRIRNIAITGPYGAGKSSVISSFIAGRDDKENFINISISSIANPDRDAQEGFNLEREISKQILNYNPSGRIGHPAKGLRSVGRFELLKDALFFAGAVIVLLMLFVLVQFGPFSDFTPSVLNYALLGAGVVAISVMGAQFLSSKHLHTTVSAGMAEVDITSTKISSFDEYSAELVTYFQNRPHTVIVFEDIDRFDDPTIFDRLHDLNGLLNSATGADKSGTPVRFIYALKESVFDGLDEEGTDAAEVDTTALSLEEASESSRRKTKFFDLVVPVLPLVSQGNSYEALTTALSKHGLDIDSRLLLLVADYIVDQRLITNIINEYAVLRPTLRFPGRDAREWDSQAFALVCYKNLFPGDFEKGQFGESTLDAIHHGFNGLKLQLLAERFEEANSQSKAHDMLFAAFREVVDNARVNLRAEIRNRHSKFAQLKLQAEEFTHVEIAGQRISITDPTLDKLMAIPEEASLTDSVKLISQTGGVYEANGARFMTLGAEEMWVERWGNLVTSSTGTELDLEMLGEGVYGIERATLSLTMDAVLRDKAYLTELERGVQKQISNLGAVGAFLVELIAQGYLDFTVSSMMSAQGFAHGAAQAGLQGDASKAQVNDEALSEHAYRKLRRVMRNTGTLNIDELLDTHCIKALFSAEAMQIDEETGERSTRGVRMNPNTNKALCRLTVQAFKRNPVAAQAVVRRGVAGDGAGGATESAPGSEQNVWFNRFMKDHLTESQDAALAQLWESMYEVGMPPEEMVETLLSFEDSITADDVPVELQALLTIGGMFIDDDPEIAPDQQRLLEGLREDLAYGLSRDKALEVARAQGWVSQG